MNDSGDFATQPTETHSRVRTRLLLGCGIAVAPLFLSVAFAQVFAVPGFDLARHAVSALQNGDYGWIQSVSFVFTGALAVLFGVGARDALRGRRAGTWGPILFSVFGLGMVLAGIFPPDPAFGFPAGAPAGPPEVMSAAGGLHSAGFFVAFVALIACCFVLARGFGAGSQGWRAYSLAVGIATPSLIALGTAAFADTAGIFYLAAGAIAFSWLSAVAAQLRSARSPAAAATTQRDIPTRARS